LFLRVAILSFLLFYLIACHTSRQATNTVLIKAGRSDSLAGLEMIRKSDCFMCHSIKEELTGPSFSEIAMKYDLTADNLDKLSKKIIKGGNGAWGQVYMIPHPQLSGTDAKTIVKYILLLKK
jgi:cytochrome c